MFEKKLGTTSLTIEYIVIIVGKLNYSRYSLACAQSSVLEIIIAKLSLEIFR